MRGNSHVQFLGGDGVVMHCLYPTFWKMRSHQVIRRAGKFLIPSPAKCLKLKWNGHLRFWRQPSMRKARANCRKVLIVLSSGLKTRLKTGDRSFGNLFSKTQ